MAGSVSGGGDLTKEGTGSAVLAASSNPISGAIAVNGGKLYVRGANAGTVTLAPGTSFGASGAVNGVLTIPAGSSPATRGTLDLADGAIGSLTVNDVSGLTLGGATGDSSNLIAEIAGAKANPLTAVLPALMKKENFEMRPLCNVIKVNTDSSGKQVIFYLITNGNEVISFSC